MTDEPENEGGPGSRKKRAGDREKAQVEPTPKRQDFFEWLETLFYEVPELAHFPDRIEAHVVSGKQFERRGASIRRYDFGPKDDTKPTRDRLVRMSNEILHYTQRDCDIQRKITVYSVSAWHFSKGDDAFERFLIEQRPGLANRNAGEPRSDDEDSIENRFSVQVLKHHESMFSLYGGGVEGLLDRFDRDKERDHNEIDRLRKENSDLRSQLERALSLEAEREEKRAWIKLGVNAAERGLNMAENVLPVLIGKFAGNGASADTLETLTLKKFFKPIEQGGQLTLAQSNAAFGVYDDSPQHNLVKPGVLTLDQGKLLYEVAFGKVPFDEIDKLLPGGSLAITGEQFQRIVTECQFSMDQILPLKIIFDGRMAKRQSSQQS